MINTNIIEVDVGSKTYIKEMIVDGHSGQTPVCAAVSTAILVTINAIKILKLEDFIKYDMDHGYFRVITNANNLITESLLFNLKYTIQDLSNQYPGQVSGLLVVTEAVMDPKEALKILGDIQLEDPVHPHLSMPKDEISKVQEAYRVVDKALSELEQMKRNG